MIQYTVLKVDKEDRIYVPTMLKYVGQIGTESKYANKYSGLVCLEFEDGNAWRFRNEWLEKVEEKEMESKFKVGDKVRLVNPEPYNGLGNCSVGDEGVVKYTDDCLIVEFPSQRGWYAEVEDLELVSDPKQKPQQVNQPVIEIGKKYRVVEVDDNWSLYCDELEDYLYMEGVCKYVDQLKIRVDIAFEDAYTWSFKPEWLVPVEEEEKTKKIKSDGGSSSYYQFTITNKQGESIEVETGDVIRCMVGNDFNLGNCVKALRRIYLAINGGGKEGVDVKYDSNKIKYFIDEVVAFQKEYKDE